MNNQIEKRMEKLEKLMQAVEGVHKFEVSVYRGQEAYRNRSDHMKRNKMMHNIIIVARGA